MALTLASTITASAREIAITGTVPAEVKALYRFRLDDEMLTLQDFGGWNGSDRNIWRVRRGLEGTTPATHSSGASVLAVVDGWASGTDEDVPSPFVSGGGSGGGGVSGVYAMLGIDNGMDVYDIGEHPLLWDVLYDDWFRWTVLDAMPNGIGLSASFDASDATITATEDGVWAFTLGVFLNSAISSALLMLGDPANVVKTSITDGSEGTLAATLAMQSGDAITPKLATGGTSTNDPNLISGYLHIVRLL